jgi:hypothetical protein
VKEFRGGQISVDNGVCSESSASVTRSVKNRMYYCIQHNSRVSLSEVAFETNIIRYKSSIMVHYGTFGNILF